MASQPTQSRLVGWLGNIKQNRKALRDSLFDWTPRHLRGTAATRDTNRRVRNATIDINSFPIEVHGDQKGAAYNGYYQETVYHPMPASFSVGGDYDSTRQGLRLGNGFIHCVLRQGNTHTAKGIKRFVRNVIDKAKQMAQNFDIRLDAGYTEGAVMDGGLLGLASFPAIGVANGSSGREEVASPDVTHRVRCAGILAGVNASDW